MKLTKRIFALALVLVMALGIFAGCTPSDDNTTTAPKGDKPADGTTAGAVSNLPEYLKVGQFPLVEGDKITLDIAVLCHDNTKKPEETYQFQFIEKYVGIDLNLTTYFYDGTRAESISLLFADCDLPDLIVGMGLDASQIVKYGMVDEMLLDMKPYINEENAPSLLKVMKDYPAYEQAMTTPDGAIYSLGSWGENDPANKSGVFRMFYNWKVMGDAGITKCPTTLDEFLDMLRTIKKKFPEMTPFGGNYARYNATYLIQNALGFNISLASSEQKSHETDIGLYKGEVSLFSYNKEILPAYLEFMHTLYEEGLMEQDYYTLDKETTKAHLTAGKYAIFSEVPSLYGGLEFGAEFWGGLPLTSEYNDTPFWPSNDFYKTGGFCVSADTEYPELCVAFADLFFGEGEMNKLLNGNGPSVTDVANGMGLGKLTQGWVYDWETNTKTYKEFESVKDEYSNQNYWIFENITFWKDGAFENSYLKWSTDENGTYIEPDDLDDHKDTIEEGAAIRHTLKDFFNTTGGQWCKALHNTFGQYETTEMTPKTCYFDEETLTLASDYKTALDAYASQSIAEFITGAKEINEANLNAYFAEMERLGAEEYVKIYADYWASVNG
jgi:hypothetical protein